MANTITVSNSSTEAFRDHYSPHLHHLPRRHNNIIPLDFHAARTTLPDSHVWPTFSASTAAVSHHPCIPVIDLKYNIHDDDDDTAATAIGQACETWGAFQIVNHGVPLSLLQEAESAAHRLFSLPMEQKLKAVRDPGSMTGYGMAKITPFFDKFMWHEGFTIIGSPVLHAAKLWPTDFAPFCELMENYQKMLQLLAHQLTTLILKSLKVVGSDINRVGSAFTALQLNSYPPCPDPARAMGLAPHTDTSLLTILHQSCRISGGLQVFKEGCWVPVRPIPGALVVDVGDLLHIVSNGRFRNVLHRVVVNEERSHRLSMAYFHGMPMDSDVKPVVRSGEVARFRPVTVKEFLAIKAKHLENALSLITI